jgi:hypothetical protein
MSPEHPGETLEARFPGLFALDPEGIGRLVFFLEDRVIPERATEPETADTRRRNRRQAVRAAGLLSALAAMALEDRDASPDPGTHGHAWRTGIEAPGKPRVEFAVELSFDRPLPDLFLPAPDPSGEACPPDPAELARLETERALLETKDPRVAGYLGRFFALPLLFAVGDPDISREDLAMALAFDATKALGHLREGLHCPPVLSVAGRLLPGATFRVRPLGPVSWAPDGPDWPDERTP